MEPSSQTINSRVHRFAFISSTLIGIIFIAWGSFYLRHDWNDQISEGFKSAIRITGVIGLLTGLLIALSKTGKMTNLKLGISAINFFYLGLEIVMYFLITLNITTPRLAIEDSSFGVFNRVCATYDSISGYKWLPVDCRITKIVNGEIIFDNKFQPNNKGYLSNLNYHFQKKDTGVTRYIVFGDSFTAGMYLDRSWPDYLQEKLDLSFPQQFEIYSFAIDGAGLFNWHRIFMREIIPHYEFDGIIIAAWGNDFSRDFAIMHHEGDGAYFGYFEDVPDNYHDFRENYFPKTWFVEITPDSIIDQKIWMIKRHETRLFNLTTPDLNILMKVYDAVTHIIYLRKQTGFEDKFISSRADFMEDYKIETFKERYGQLRYEKLDAMIEHCKANDKQVIFCTQADEVGIRDLKIGNYHFMQGELEGLAAHYDVEYFDGLQYYLDLSEEEIKASFLKFDPHWSQKGSDIFAENFSNYFIQLHNP